MISGHAYDAKKLPAFLLTVTLLAFVAVSCGDDDMPPPPAHVIVGHASPDAPPVDFLVDGSRYTISPPLEFPETTKYLPVSAGNRNVKLNVAGTADTALSETFHFVSGMDYTLFAVGALADISFLLIDDDLTSPAEGNAHARFVHLSPDAPPVDIVNLADSSTVFGNTAFKGYTDFTPLPAATYRLQVRRADTGEVVLSPLNVTLEEFDIFTIYAYGFAADLDVEIIDHTAEEGGLCFIATAAFGTGMAGKIDVLKDLRDGHLTTSREGMAFVDLYYRISPPIAQYIDRCGWLKAVVRTMLLPVVGLGWLFL